MCTRGILRSSIPSTFPNGVVMRSSGGPSTLKELSNELIAVDIDDAVRRVRDEVSSTRPELPADILDPIVTEIVPEAELLDCARNAAAAVVATS